jgi:hypothetical protein
MSNLQSYRTNITSQFGEDGIVEEILNRLGEGERRCVEFGAWDGRHYSNTWKLWHDRGWSAILIEGNYEKYAALQESLAAFPEVLALHAMVSWEGEDRLDQLLRRAGVNGRIDVMSIDIDGDDYHVFAAITDYLPRILLVEFNPTCPPGAVFVQEKGGRFGSSATSILRMAESKGYALAACTDTNLILVRQEEFGRLGIPPLELSAILPRDHLTYLMTDYDGVAYLSQPPVYMSEVPSGAWQFFRNRLTKWTRFRVGNAFPVRIIRPRK